ncbi:hypothetical protein [Bacillus phage 1_ICo-2020]|uniref:Uncharacterized protein n=1 Tax=Bacillus phage 1_ICo-2020 TaxID=2759272 RepID=A0A7G8AKE9_9CAUD|nr:hypothetical protein [Bacillus phage 1_ICo-2020]
MKHSIDRTIEVMRELYLLGLIQKDYRACVGIWYAMTGELKWHSLEWTTEKFDDEVENYKRKLTEEVN